MWWESTESVRLYGLLTGWLAYGHYTPNMVVITPDGMTPGDMEDAGLTARVAQCFDGGVTVYQGYFRRSHAYGFKRVFDMTGRGHVLIVVRWGKWGGRDDPSKGGSKVALPRPKWHRWTASKSGKTGYQYWVFTREAFQLIGGAP